MQGPIAARRSEGFDLNLATSSPTVFSRMRARVPRQPAWTAATARFLGSTRRMGTQSAVWTPRRRPGVLVIEASPLQGSLGAVAKGLMTAEWICLRLMSGNFWAPRADWNFLRFSRTFSRVSQSVKPRLRIFCASRSEMPPGAVLKPWRSQGSFLKASSSRIFRVAEERKDQGLATLAGAVGGGSGLPALRRGREDFEATGIQ